MTTTAFVCLIPHTGLNSAKVHHHYTLPRSVSKHWPLTEAPQTGLCLEKGELCQVGSNQLKTKSTGQTDLTKATVNLIQSNPIHLMEPILASGKWLEFDAEIVLWLGPNGLSVRLTGFWDQVKLVRSRPWFQRLLWQDRHSGHKTNVENILFLHTQIINNKAVVWWKLKKIYIKQAIYLNIKTHDAAGGPALYKP